MVGGMHGRGACMVGGTCMAGGMCGRGACVVGGMHGILEAGNDVFFVNFKNDKTIWKKDLLQRKAWRPAAYFKLP